MESPLKNNPDQQAASVQLPWLEQQQRDREALAAETDQAPPQESTGDGVKRCDECDWTFGCWNGKESCRKYPHLVAPAVAEQEPQLFRKKPVVIEAIKWTGWNAEEMRAFGVPPTTAQYQQRGRMLIPTLEGEMTAQVGDWIIKGVKGEFYPCKPDIFVSTYEPAAPVAVGETPETDSLWVSLMEACKRAGIHPFSANEAFAKLNAFYTIERQRDAARRERDEAKKQNTLFEEEMDAIRTVRDIARERCKKQEEQLTALTAERDELMRRFTVIGRLIRKALPNICNPEGFPYERTLGIIREHRKLVAERDRAREELDMTRGSERILAQGFAHLAKQLGHTGDDCNPEIISQLIADLKAALATAQADIAELCSVIAAAFAETAKPLNASVEYDARPTEGERLKKIQENLASAIDAASATEGGQS